jgi:halimadienyl-diphosphate synthase
LDIEARARRLLQELDGRIGPSPYDTAWMARLPGDSAGNARWPDLTEWLIEHQWLDGSWGGAIRYYHDRILCTLAAIIALREHGASQEAEEAIKRGEQFIWKSLQFLHHDPVELVGFELILPTLMAEARSLGLGVPNHSGGYARIRAEKLRLLPMELLYSRGMPAAFSLEFLGHQRDVNHIHRLQGPNGSIADSPAATSYFLTQTGDNQRALAYLGRMKARPHGIPAFYPFRTFETVWVLEHLAFGALPLGRLVPPSTWEELKSIIGPEGVGIDPTFGINDGDTTAVTLHVLALGGQSVDPMILRHFEEPEALTFRTFVFERNASVATNAHALEALALMSDYPNRQEVWDRVVATLLATQKYRSYWIDKWHASPYYATSHTLMALIGVRERMLIECLHSIDWLLHTQREDGSWGYFDRGTAEETAYALLALLHYHRQVQEVDVEILRKGISFLHSAVDQTSYTHPDLWIAKSLYMPENIVTAAILAALNLCQDTFGYISA